MELYPSEYARTRLYPNSGVHPGAAEDAETSAIRCAQCGLPIEDYTRISACPNCSSDNVLGAKLW